MCYLDVAYWLRELNSRESLDNCFERMQTYGFDADAVRRMLPAKINTNVHLSDVSDFTLEQGLNEAIRQIVCDDLLEKL